MRHMLAMQVSQNLEQLLNDSLALVFREPSLRLSLKVTMKTLSAGILHNQIHDFGCVNAFVKLDNVWVVQLGQYLDFPERRLPPLGVH